MLSRLRSSRFLGKALTGGGLLLVLGFGCSGVSTTDLKAVRPVTLNYWTIYNDTAALENLAAKYRQTRPHVTINIRQVRSDEFDRLFTNALADDVAPDIVSMHTRWLRRFQGRLVAMPATTKMGRLVTTGSLKKETHVETDVNQMPTVEGVKKNYVSAVAADVVNGTTVYGLPLSFDNLAIYYNKDLLDKAGVPEPPKTWDEFLAAVKAATKFDKDGKIVQSGVALGTDGNIDNAFDILSVLMLQNGVTVASGRAVTFAEGVDKVGPGHPTLQALDFYTNFARPNKESYSWNDQMEPAFESFVHGKSVFYFGFAFDYTRVKSRAPDMNLEVIALPQLNSAAPANIANYWVESVVRKSKRQNEAWDFVRYITSPANVLAYTNATGRPSPYRSHIKEQEKNPQIGPFTSQILVSKNWYNGTNWDAARDAFKDLISGYLQPYAEGENNPFDRDIKLLKTAAQVVQQTM